MENREAPQLLWAPPAERAESDCACPDAGAALSFPPAFDPAGLWQAAPNLYRAPLPAGHELVFNPVGHAGVVVLNRPARALLDTFCQPRPLENEAARQMAALGLLCPEGKALNHPADTPSTLTAWLHVTNTCNLRCSYCYVAKTREHMDAATGLAAVETIFRVARRYGFRAVKLKYAGGEPTLNFRLVSRLHRHARTLAARHDIDLRAVLLSNGVALKEDVLMWLRDEGVRLMVSLDGIGAAHDAQRPLANGRGSFALVVRGIDRALAHRVLPHLSVTVTAHTAHRLAEVVAFAIERDLPFNLNFYRDWAAIPSAATWRAESETIVRGVREAFAVIEHSMPRRRLIDALIDRSAFDTPHTRPCGAGHHYLVVDHKGRVARCHMEIERPVTSVFADDPLAAIRNVKGRFQNVTVDEKQECRTCTWRYWCAGGCPLLTFRLLGRSDVKSPYCDVYRALYPEVVRLEGLRLLKWASQPTDW